MNASEKKGTKSIESAYDLWHTDLARREMSGNVLSKIWYQKVIANLPDLNGKRVLEIGCGRGEFSSFIHRTFPAAKIIASDFSSGAIEVCKEKYQENEHLAFRVEDVTRLSFDDGKFDVVICCETLEHVPAVEMALGEITRVLISGGEFLITTPSYFNAYAAVWFKCWLLNRPFASGEGIQPFEHFYTSFFVRRLLKRNSLKLDRYSSSHFQWLVFPRTDPAKLRTVEFRSVFFNRLFRPFGVHFFYRGHKDK